MSFGIIDTRKEMNIAVTLTTGRSCLMLILSACFISYSCWIIISWIYWGLFPLVRGARAMVDAMAESRQHTENDRLGDIFSPRQSKRQRREEGARLSYHICTYSRWRCTCYVFLSDWLIINFGQLKTCSLDK